MTAEHWPDCWRCPHTTAQHADDVVGACTVEGCPCESQEMDPDAVDPDGIFQTGARA